MRGKEISICLHSTANGRAPRRGWRRQRERTSPPPASCTRARGQHSKICRAEETSLRKNVLTIIPRYLDDQENPEDCDAAVCCEEHVEARVETVVVEPGHERVLAANDQPVEDTNVLKMCGL